MSVRRDTLFTSLRFFALGGAICLAVCSGAIPVTAEQRPPRRIPPGEAIEACKGKQEGDACAFISPRGYQEGLCLAGQEQIFACRPHRGKPSAAGEPATAPQLPTKPEPRTEPPMMQPLPATGKELPATAPVPSDQRAAPTSAPQPAVQTPSAANQPPPLALPVEAERVARLPQQMTANPFVLVVTALLASGLTWLAFHRYSTVPLRRLRAVTQQLAGGDLSARVGEGLVSRQDEIANLGRDVDRMAERIENLVSAHQRLIRDVSHELRSPLARLNVALELARQSAGSGHSAPFDRIERESERLNELIGQLLLLTKLESDCAMNLRTELDIAALIAEVAQDADFEAQGNERRVMAAGAEPLIMNGNRELLRQALENLIRNAARYTAPGTVVEISLKRKETGGRKWAHIEVRDYGPGVPESELFDIFRPFYRVNDARERQSGGAGVGLAISERAVRLHGGSLRAFNAPGAGLIMEMELPLA